MGRGRRAAVRLTVAGAALLALGPGAALAAKGNVKFGGDTEEGRKAKIVVDSQGRAIRGTWTVLTDCDGQFDDFRVQIEMRGPLDRSTKSDFRDAASDADSDDTYSARYMHKVRGEYTGKHEIQGTLETEVVFRRDGKKYVTCTDEVEFTVNELKSS